MLGLIANNFIRVYHPLVVVTATKTEPEKTECKNAPGTLENITIDAAILAIKHSFIVDNYDCGESLGELTVHGAISQKYRGAVGTTRRHRLPQELQLRRTPAHDRATELHRAGPSRLGDRAGDGRLTVIFS